jgi:penicillin-binding protein 2
VSETESVPGSYLVTSLDARLQSVVEEQLAAAVKRAKKQGASGDSGSAVVIDTTNGQVLAMASYPTYDPSVWVGGIDKKTYGRLTGTKAGLPLLNRTIQGLFPPASTFKVVSTAAAANSGLPLDGPYDCSSEFKIGTQTFRNFESSSAGKISVARALEISCNTVFYRIAYNLWQRDGGSDPVSKPRNAIENAAKGFGLGQDTGIDLPGEYAGRVGGRNFKQEYWDQYHDVWCERKDDRSRSAYLRAIDADNCERGYVYRGGDAANLAIGQGDTVATPLQMAMVYAAIANGGTLYEPHLAKAVVSSDGRTVTRVKPVKRGTLPMSKATLAYLQRALEGVTTNEGGTGSGVFSGFPLAKVPVSAKTGSGQVVGKDPVVWFASYAPSTAPRYAVVMTVQGGKTGAETVGPGVRKIYEAIYGVTGSTIDPKRSVLLGGKPSGKIPAVKSDGTIAYPGSTKGKLPTSRKAAVPAPTTPSASPSASTGSDAAAPSSAALLVAPLMLGVAWRRRRRDGPSVVGGVGRSP